MNKKILTIFLAILLICTLCVTIVACGDKDNNDDANPNGEQTDTPSTDTPAPDDGGSSPIEPSSSNLLFNLKTNDTYEVVGYTGEPISVVIPATYNGKAVTSIGDGAFANCISLSSVTIPDSVTSVGSSAFSNCPIEYASIPTLAISSIPKSNLKEVVITGGEIIDNYAFYEYDTLTSVTIPDSVTGIGSYAFYSCDSLTSVTIPNSVIYIGWNAFQYCTSLSSVTIPDSVTSIGDMAFYNCPIEYASIPTLAISSISNSNLKEVVITSGDSIGDEAFSSCTSLSSVTIPDSVTSIGSNAFVGCPIEYASIPTLAISSISNSNLKEVVITSGVSIGDEAFENCYSLSSVTIPDSVTSIGDDAFNGCYKLVEVYNLSSLTIKKGSSSNGNVGYYALDVYTSLDTPSKLSTDSNGYIIHTNGAKKTLIGYTRSETELTLPSGITSINQFAFFKDYNITSVVIPDSVTSIGSSAFYNCTSLTSVTIPDSVTSIGYEAFYSCDSLTSVTIPDSVKSIGDKAFYSCDSLISVTIPNSVTSIGKEAFYSCDSLISVTIPNSVTSIGVDAFYNCPIEYASIPTKAISSIPKSKLKEVVITSGVSIGYEAFEDCYSLSSVTIGNSVTSIGSYAFENCPIEYASIPTKAISSIPKSKLKEVAITGGYSIGDEAFYDCDSLTSVTIGNSVTSIGNDAFYKCNSLSSVNYLGTIEQWCGITFADYYANPLSYVKKLYLNGELLEEELVIPNTVTEIKDYAFESCTSIKSVSIPDSVTSIGYDAFYNCTSLSSVTIGNSVTSIGDKAFRDCYRLVEVYNLSSLTIEKGSDSNGYVGYYALGVYTSLEAPSKLSTDSNGYIIHTNGAEKTLVRYVGSESELTLPSGITSIHHNAFYENDTITSVVIPDSVTSIGESAFWDCYRLVEVYNLSSLTIKKGSSSNGNVGYYALDVYTSLDTPSKLSTDSNGYIIHTNGEEKILVGYTGNETELTLPSGITSINLYAFRENDTITSVVIPYSVTSIGGGAFGGCTSLSSVTIGYRVRSIGNSAFSDCDSLSSVRIGNSVTSIGSFAFYSCDSLSSVTIPNSVTSIGDAAFYYCDSLSRVYYNGTKEEWSSISIGGYYNYDLKGATRYYYSASEPTTSGNYWHYGEEGIPTPW